MQESNVTTSYQPLPTAISKMSYATINSLLFICYVTMPRGIYFNILYQYTTKPVNMTYYSIPDRVCQTHINENYGSSVFVELL